VTQVKDSNNNVRTAAPCAAEVNDTGTGAGVETDDDECSLEGDEDMDDDGQTSMLVDDDEGAGPQSDSVSGRTGSGAASFSPDAGKLDDDSAIYDMSLNRSANSLPDDRAAGSPLSKTPAAAAAAAGSSSSGGGNDLLLSSPHDYTAQVP